jgi:tetratricopeptide (TPR) repeat protein
MIDQRRSLRVLTLVLGSSFLFGAGCGAGEGTGPAGSGSAGAAQASASQPDLIPLPQPDLSRFSEGVQRQIRERQRWQFRIFESPDAGAKEKAASFGELGNLYHAYGLGGEAEVCYLNARKLDPEEYRWAYYLCRLRGSGKEPQRAVESCREANALNPNDVALKVRLAELLSFMGEKDEAAELFGQALSLDNENAAAFSGLGQIAMAAKDAASAAARFEKVLQLQPEATATHAVAAQAYRDLGDTARAEKHAAAAGDGEVRLAEPLMASVQGLSVGQQLFRQRAQKAYQEERWQEAVDDFRRAVAADPLYADLRISLAAALLKVEDPAGALEQYELAVKLAPQNPRANFGAAFLLQSSGKDQEAAESYRRVLAAEPDNRAARVNLAQALFESGQYEESKAELDLVLTEDPGNVAMRLAQLGSLVKLGRYSEAITQLEKGLEAVPGNAPLRQALARLLATAPDAAVRNGARAVELARALFDEQKAPEHAETLAMALAEGGDLQEAVRLQQALVDAAKEAGREDLRERLDRNLQRYRQGERALPPWQAVTGGPQVGTGGS